ncbi:hypothetical protein [Burkholderia lata]|uniref:hypothetical protein n=1 Tax=Burkholderia lata (strain ATCC 17760 / DSM 23089 / LMG 22485 / NCIMB 9086 / R18194 / 383) TaxID=482957 RepID=UPI001583A2BC|nr:hypothetical protein [Burkholderia lata]
MQLEYQAKVHAGQAQMSLEATSYLRDARRPSCPKQICKLLNEQHNKCTFVGVESAQHIGNGCQPTFARFASISAAGHRARARAIQFKALLSHVVFLGLKAPHSFRHSKLNSDRISASRIVASSNFPVRD